MNINITENGTIFTFHIEGRIDTTTSPELEKAIGEVIDNAESIVLDFCDVEYISSAGLRVLLMTHKLMSKKSGMEIKNVSNDIMEIFEVTGFSDILNIK